MITIKHNSITYEFENLDQAMAWAKKLGEFVKIEFNGMEIVGKFGADGISNGKLSNGDDYSWTKRRKIH